MKLTEQWVSIWRAAKTVKGAQSYFPHLDFNSKHNFENFNFNCFVQWNDAHSFRRSVANDGSLEAEQNSSKSQADVENALESNVSKYILCNQ